MIMKYTISERTVTVETTQPGETLREVQETVKMLALPTPSTWDEVQAEVKALLHTPAPLDDLSYTDVDPYTLATEELEHMVPANYLAAE
jgi:hypothetical protein